jgi:hypothetical protein
MEIKKTYTKKCGFCKLKFNSKTKSEEYCLDCKQNIEAQELHSLFPTFFATVEQSLTICLCLEFHKATKEF